MSKVARPSGPFQSATIIPPQGQEPDPITILLGLLLASPGEEEAAPTEEPGFFQGLFMSFLGKVLGFGGEQRTMRDAANMFIPSGSTVLRPELIDRMNNNPQIREYVNYITKNAEAMGLDGAMAANQIDVEVGGTGWNPRAVSPKKAKGLGQFTEPAARQYGIAGREFDPYASLEAYLRYMRDLTNQYGDQRLALIAYNGGGAAIDSVKAALGKDDVTVADFMSEMNRRRLERGTHVASAWHVETRNYVLEIDSAFWSEKRRNTAIAKMNEAGFGAPAAATQVAGLAAPQFTGGMS